MDLLYVHCTLEHYDTTTVKPFSGAFYVDTSENSFKVVGADDEVLFTVRLSCSTSSECADVFSTNFLRMSSIDWVDGRVGLQQHNLRSISILRDSHQLGIIYGRTLGLLRLAINICAGFFYVSYHSESVDLYSEQQSIPR